MAKAPKPEQQSTGIIPVIVGGVGGGGGGASEIAAGAVPASGGALEGAGAETDSSAPVTNLDHYGLPLGAFDAITAAVVQDIAANVPEGILDRVAEMALRRLMGPEADELVARLAGEVVKFLAEDPPHMLVDAVLRASMASSWTPRDLEAPLPDEDGAAKEALCVALGIDPANVLAANPDTRTVVTRDGQKHRLT